ncbi:hypothetical protein KJ865_03150, partial [Myxococcota bacterium]|nr:hypothetical protein [Myxococcota bacterium]
MIYENGIFIDVQQGRTLPPSWRLEVRNGEIAAMGPKVFGRGGERCIDLGGAFVVPGLINAHAHIHLAMPAIAASLKTFLVGRVLRSGQVKRTLTSALEHGVT